MNSLKYIAFAGFLLSSLTYGAEPAKAELGKTAVEALQGTWKVVGLEAQGTQAPPEIVAVMSLVFKAETLTFVPGEPGFTHFTFKLDPTTKPASFDLISTDGKGVGKKGIYLLEGDNLKICLGMTDRPKIFLTGAGSPEAMYQLKRIEP